MNAAQMWSERDMVIRANLEAFRQAHPAVYPLLIDLEVRIATAYVKGARLDDIADDYSITKEAVIRVARRAGIALRGVKSGPNSYQSMPALDDAARARLLDAFIQNEGSSVDDLAARFRISVRTLHRYAQAAGLKRNKWPRNSGGRSLSGRFSTRDKKANDATRY